MTVRISGTFARAMTLAAALALPAARLHAQQQPVVRDTAYHPRNVKEAASNTGHEAKRVTKRSEKAVAKAADDTKKQAVRTGNWAKRTVSSKERRRQAAAKHDSSSN